jgi:hypothetical protein
MGTKAKKDDRDKKLRKRQRAFERALEEATAGIDVLVRDARARVERQLAEVVDSLSGVVHTTADRAEALFRTEELRCDAALRDVTADVTAGAEARLRAAIGAVEAEREQLELTRAQVTASADDLAAQIRTEGARLDRSVDAEIAGLSEQVQRATEGHLTTVADRVAEFDQRCADALGVLEARVAEAEQRIAEMGAETVEPIPDELEAAAPEVLEPAEEPVAGSADEPAWTADEPAIEPAIEPVIEPALEPVIEPTDEPAWTTWVAESDDWPTGEATVAGAGADRTDPDLMWTALVESDEHGSDPVGSPPPDCITSTPAASAHGLATTAAALAPDLPGAAVTTAAPGHPVTFETPRPLLLASLSELRRTAADGWVRVEVVHRASHGQAVASLRLTVHDIFGGWEYHDLPGRVSSGPRRAVTADAGELLQAIQVDDRTASATTVVIDGNITIGRVLVLGRSEPSSLQGERRKVERIELPTSGREAVQLDTLVGRFVVPSRVASSLRSRRATDIDLITVGDQVCLSARVPGPAPDITATLETPLYDEASEEQASAADRREASESAVDQLVRALSIGSSPEELVAIVNGGVGYARRRAAAHPSLPPDVIVAILTDGTEAMRAAAAANPNIPPAAIEQAVTDSAPVVRAAVAVNPRVAPAQLFALGHDDSAEVRACVARNPALTPEMLALLADDRDATVRATVAAHQACPVDVLARLADDQFTGVCARVAEHASCPIEILEQLLGIVPEVVLSNPRAPEHLLIAGSLVASPALRAAVAANPSTPTRELQSLARDPDRAVVRALASNPNTPTGARRKARRRSERARAAAYGSGRRASGQSS